jgi:integrase
MPLKLVKRHSGEIWYIRGSVRGRSLDESTRVTDRKVAEEIRTRREYELLQASVHGRKSTATFLAASVAYMENGGERRFLKRVIEYFGDAPLAKIDQAAIDRAAKALYPKAKSSTITRQLFTPVSAVLKFAAARGMCEFSRLERPPQPRGRTRWIEPEEAERLIAACSPHLKPFVIFLFCTGARLSEALRLDWKNVDLARGEVQFLATKNGDSRGVPLHPRAVRALRGLKGRSGAVFRRPDGKPYEPNPKGGVPVKTAFKGACRRAGIEDFTIHSIRHSWATLHYRTSRDLPSLMRLGGWRTQSMVVRYLHVNVGHLTQSIAAMPWGKSGEKPRVIRKKKGTTNG